MSSQNNIDSIIFSIFGENKFFLEAGGSHPIDQNNTYFLEQKGWYGLIVEPKLDFNDLYKELRPKSILENYVLVSKDYTEEEIEGDFSHYMVGGIINNNITNIWNPKKHKCITLEKLFDKHNINEVHFFSLDVEGYESEVLNGINFSKVLIHFIVLESHSFHGFKNVSEDFSFLEKEGFEKIKKINQHEFYLNKNSEFYNLIKIFMS